MVPVSYDTLLSTILLHRQTHNWQKFQSKIYGLFLFLFIDKTKQNQAYSGKSQTPARARQTTEASRNRSTGHSMPAPVQNSGASQAPTDSRHIVVDGAQLSAGQLELKPSQYSTTSHDDAAGRHTMLLGATLSDGQSYDTPSQYSGASHGSIGLAGRHIVVGGFGGAGKQLPN
jgi:hypothetical protein